LIVIGFFGCDKSAVNPRNPREELALAGAASLRAAFNRGACWQIFDEADDVFRASQADWLDVCEQLRKKLGWWRSFHAQLDRRDGVPINRVVVYGEADFAKGRYHLETVWHFDRGRVELFSLGLWGGSEQIQIPAPRAPRRLLMDPPPKQKPTTSYGRWCSSDRTA
jgi:hypothetical protein